MRTLQQLRNSVAKSDVSIELLTEARARCKKDGQTLASFFQPITPEMVKKAWITFADANPPAPEPEEERDPSYWFPREQTPPQYEAQVVELVTRSHHLANDSGEFHLYPIEDAETQIVGTGIGLNNPTPSTLAMIGSRWRDTMGEEAWKCQNPKWVRSVLDTFLVLTGSCTDAPPALYVQPESKEWAFARRTIDADDRVPFPNIGRILAAMNDGEAFAAKLFAIAYGLDTSRQALYLRGLGKDGKSSFLKAFVRILGERVTKPITGIHVSQSSKFLAAEYKDTALVYSPDNNNPAILLTEVVKSITGDDKVAYEKKYGGFGEYNSRAKLVIFSNHRPMVLNERHSLSRILYVELGKIAYTDIGVEAFSEACWQEMPGFLAYGAACYEKRWANNMIELNAEAQAALESLVADTSFEWDVFVNANLTFVEDGELTAQELSQMLEGAKLNKPERADMRKKLQNDDRVRFVPRDANDRTRIYRGVRKRVPNDLVAVGDLSDA